MPTPATAKGHYWRHVQPTADMDAETLAKIEAAKQRRADATVKTIKH